MNIRTAEAPATARPLGACWVARAARQVAPELALDDSRPVADAAEAWGLVGDALACDESALVARLAPAARVAVADLSRPDPRLVTFVPLALAKRHGVVPTRTDQRTIWLATSDPLDFDAEQAVGFVTSRTVILELAGPQALAAYHDAVYHPGQTVSRIVEALAPSADAAVVEVEEAPAPVDVGRDPALDAPVARLLDAVLSDAVRDGASDIHIEPVLGGVTVRYRVDGILKDVMKLPENTGIVLVRRVKVVARLDVTNSMRPQDGRMALRVDGQTVDLRVSTLPVARRGEKIVVRILDKRHLKLDLGTLGLAESEQRQLQRLLSHREGLLLVTGPTGSGKTTTLYAALNQLRTGKVNITTVEDPVEYDIPDIAQIQVNEAQGLTFAAALRSVLRQDPDVVLVGEIRDRETAEIAVQASMTGHLVLSTLHTNDAPSAAVRMRDMGVDGFKLGSTLIGVVAQRLIRRLCDKCAVPLAAEELPAEARPPVGQAVAVRRAVGCEECGGTGYRGRLPIVEVLVVDPLIGRQIETGESPIAIASVARRSGTRTLWESGLERVWRGLTDLAELHRVVGEHGEAASDAGAPVGETASSAAPVVDAPTTVGGDEPAPAAPIKKPRARKPKKAAAPAAPAPPPVVAAAPAPDAAARVLVVDDDPQMRRFVRMVLEREQHHVTEAGDGLEALEAAERDRPDLVVMDLDMPRLDGMATLEELRDRPETAALPVILLTARTEDEGDALDRGASDFLAKPLQPKALAARVRAVLRRARV